MTRIKIKGPIFQFLGRPRRDPKGVWRQRGGVYDGMPYCVDATGEFHGVQIGDWLVPEGDSIDWPYYRFYPVSAKRFDEVYELME